MLDLPIFELKDDADMILIGIGEEFEAGMSVLEKSAIYTDFISKLQNENLLENNYDFLYPALLSSALNESDCGANIREAYSKLFDFVKEKNYFVISMNMDSLLENSDFDKMNIVQPFGSYERLQCIEGCDDIIVDGTDYNNDVADLITNPKRNILNFKRPICTVCGREMVANTVNSHRYIETGYLENWDIYQKWLMGTVNKKLLVLELGVTLQYPNLIRWPFEKMVMYNQKSHFVRVNEHFAQLTPETSDRGFSEECNSVEFVNKYL